MREKCFRRKYCTITENTNNPNKLLLFCSNVGRHLSKQQVSLAGKTGAITIRSDPIKARLRSIIYKNRHVVRCHRKDKVMAIQYRAKATYQAPNTCC